MKKIKQIIGIVLLFNVLPVTMGVITAIGNDIIPTNFWTGYLAGSIIEGGVLLIAGVIALMFWIIKYFFNENKDIF